MHPRHRIGARLVIEIAETVLKEAGRKGKAELEIVFVDDAEIRKLNKRYKDEDAATDVLSFALEAEVSGKTCLYGDVFISLDTAERNARTFGTVFEEEVARYVIHGILHLFGYDDAGVSDRRRMWAVQEKILCRIRKQEDLSKVLTRR